MTKPEGPSRQSRRMSTKGKGARKRALDEYLSKFRNGKKEAR